MEPVDHSMDFIKDEEEAKAGSRCGSLASSVGDPLAKSKLASEARTSLVNSNLSDLQVALFKAMEGQVKQPAHPL